MAGCHMEHTPVVVGYLIDVLDCHYVYSVVADC